jgi:CHAD domain-containing protein
VLRLLAHDHVVRLDDDPEGVHQARVATRRLRSDLRTFRRVVDREWSEPLRDELSWLADALGEVRDADVLLHGLDAAIDQLDEARDAAAARELTARLRSEREQAQVRLVGVLDSSRYAVLLDRLVDGALEPRLLDAAGDPAHKALPPFVARPWRKLVDEVKGLPADPGPEAFHRVRIRAKRARYAAEVAAPVLGSRFGRVGERLAVVQDVLGDEHDAVVAADWLRTAAIGAAPAVALVAGELIGAELARATEVHERWPAAWKRARRAAAKAGL